MNNADPELEICCFCGGCGMVPPTNPEKGCFTCFGTGYIWSSMYVDEDSR